MKRLSILGSSGSIGLNCLKIAKEYKDIISVEALTVNKNWKLLMEQILEFKPKIAVISDIDTYKKHKHEFNNIDVELLSGKEGVIEAAKFAYSNLVINSIVGSAGLEPTYQALSSKKDVALANKETLVVGGKVITDIAKDNKCKIIPIDSEHSAIFQCLNGENHKNVKNIILTCSGGPFHDTPISEFKNITLEKALKHPKWKMGSKITIDSSTLMNKGLEVIEAYHLFNVKPENIKVVIHKQSIIHSMVEFIDNSIISQLGVTDMRIPILYSIFYPDRVDNIFDDLEFDFFKHNTLTFDKPDMVKFPCLKYAYECLNDKNNKPIILNGVNEIAVEYFLNSKIHYTDIPKIIDNRLKYFNSEDLKTIDEIIEFDKFVKNDAKKYIQNNF